MGYTKGKYPDISFLKRHSKTYKDVIKVFDNERGTKTCD